jgi:hypothetical protein
MSRRIVSSFGFLAVVVLAGLGSSAPEDVPVPAPSPDRGAQGRLATARDAFKSIDQMRLAGQHIDAMKHYVWSRRLMEAEQEMAGSKAERVAAAKAHLGRIERLMKDIQLQYENAELGRLDYLDSQYHYNEAISAWEQEKAE